MRLSVRVIPRSSQEKIVEENGKWKVYVHASPERGKANRQLCALIAKKLKVSKSRVHIIQGETSHSKIVEVCNGTT